jgi:hypothetical protein
VLLGALVTLGCPFFRFEARGGISQEQSEMWSYAPRSRMDKRRVLMVAIGVSWFLRLARKNQADDWHGADRW